MEDHRRWRSEADRLRWEARAEQHRMETYWNRVMRNTKIGTDFFFENPDVRDVFDAQMSKGSFCCWPTCRLPKAEGLQVCKEHALEAGGAFLKELGPVLADKRRYDKKQAKIREQERRWDRREKEALERMRKEGEEFARKERELMELIRKASLQRAVDTGEKIEYEGLLSEWVYFVRTDGLVKIGYTSDPGSRLKAYPPSAEVLVVMPGNRWLETQLHRKFATYLARGREWFTESDKLHEYIEQQIENYGQPKPEWSTERFARGRFESEEILEDGTRKIQLRTKRPAA